MASRAVAVLLSVTLAGCGGGVVTDPSAAEIAPFRMAQLRAPQAVALSNGLKSEVRYELRSASGTWVLDARQMTDTAIVMLGRALERQGIAAAPESAKAIMFRIRVRGATAMFVPVPTVTASARLTLEVDFGDGTATSLEGEGGSAFGVQPAFEGAILSALHRLLLDEKFIAYMNR